MPQEDKPVDYTAIINDLEKKKVALESTIAALKAFQAIGSVISSDVSPVAGNVGNGGNGELGTPEELPKGALHNKSLPAAIKLYLSAVKRKKTIKEISTALQDNGMETTSDSFDNVVTGALNRLKRGGEVLRFKDGWGLAEWYPEAFRSRITPGEKPTRRKGKKKRGKRTPGHTDGKPEQPSLEDRLKPLLDRSPSGGKMPKELASELGTVGITGAVGLALERMVKKGKAFKDVHGKYHPKPVAVGA